MFRGKKWKQRRFTETDLEHHIRVLDARIKGGKAAWKARKLRAKTCGTPLIRKRKKTAGPIVFYPPKGQA